MYYHRIAIVGTVKNVVGAVGEIVDRLTLPAREKKQLETELLRAFMEWEKRVMEGKTAMLAEDRKSVV